MLSVQILQARLHAHVDQDGLELEQLVLMLMNVT